MIESGCRFCKSADFKKFGTFIDRDNAKGSVMVSPILSEYQVANKFQYCPVCGKKITEAEESKPMDIGQAIKSLKAGKCVRRRGWNGKGMYLVLVNQKDYEVSMVYPNKDFLLPWIGMKTADDHFVPWIASQTDLLSDDWEYRE